MATKHFCPHCDKEIEHTIWKSFCDRCGMEIPDSKQVLIMAQTRGNIEQKQTMLCPTCAMSHLDLFSDEIRQTVMNSVEVPR